MPDTRPDMEAEYNNRMRVPEHPELIANSLADAAAFRAGRSDAKLDLAYGPAERQTFDYFPASSGAPARERLAVFIHGGYWQALDKTSYSHLARGLNGQGYDVVNANYTLCPAVSVTDIIAEMQMLADHLFRTYGRTLLVYGHSAGGHLAASLMATDWKARGLPANLVDRAMPVSGLFDLVPLVETSINTALGMTPETARTGSPLFWPAPAGGRFIAAVGGDESPEFLRQSQELVSAWSGPDLTGTLDIQAGANHFTVVNPLADPDSALTRALATLGS